MTFLQPGPREVRVTVLGKGRGESVVVHMGDGRWMIVDSLKGTWGDEVERAPAALSYLKALGLDPAQAVEAVVLTHLHADHSEGIEDIVRACTDAAFYLPSAIPDEGWRRLLRTLEAEADPEAKPKISEIETAYRLAKDTGRFRTIGATELVGDGETVRALAPVSAAQQAAREVTARGAPAHVAKLMRQNATSIVLWVQAGAGAALLCADMDDHAELGWPEILREHQGKPWLRRAGYVKIAHHGSKASQSEAMFQRWTEEPIGVLTPNRLGRVQLPKPDHLPVLHPLTRSLWIAGRPDDPPPMTAMAKTYDTDVWWVEASCDPTTGRWTSTARDEMAQRLHPKTSDGAA